SLQREEAHPPRDPVDRVERVCHEADEPEIRELARPVTLPPDRPEETAGFVVDPDLSVDGLSDVDVALGSDGEAVHRRDSDQSGLRVVDAPQPELLDDGPGGQVRHPGFVTGSAPGD